MNVLLTLSYDGTDFCGYQIQPNKRTVQGALEDALFTLTGEKVKTVASGRTDSGVHALSQKVNFKTTSTIPPQKFQEALNALLPSDVKVLKSQMVADNFNARYNAKSKTYIYKVYFSSVDEPLKSRYAVKIHNELDITLMKNACKILEGTHDFKCFLSSGSSVKDTVRTIYSAKIKNVKGGLEFSFTGNGFLYNMVRIMVGTLVAVGEGKKTLDDLKSGLLSGERTRVGKTMPPQGLTLFSVKY